MVRLKIKVFVHVCLLTVHRGGQRAIRVVPDQSIKEGNLIVLFLFYRELDGRFDGIEMVMKVT